jgi:uncharacterized membrane protein YoaK (UPF0700 family)
MDNQWQARDLFVPLVLTATAGFVDAVGYLTYTHIYTANMSGNSVAVGIGLGTRNWAMFLLRLWPVLIYVIGLLSGRTLLEVAGRLRLRRAATLAFSFEVAALAFVAWSGTAGTQWLWIALLAWSMGIQNAVLTQFSTITVHSGFVTGTLLKFSEQFVKYAAGLWDQSKKRRHPDRVAAGRRSGFLLMIWIAYTAGAAGGAWAQGLAATRALLLPMLCLLLLSAKDMANPLAVQDEQQQMQTA